MPWRRGYTVVDEILNGAGAVGDGRFEDCVAWNVFVTKFCVVGVLRRLEITPIVRHGAVCKSHEVVVKSHIFWEA
mgnify:CR=1 FL=1